MANWLCHVSGQPAKLVSLAEYLRYSAEEVFVVRVAGAYHDR